MTFPKIAIGSVEVQADLKVSLSFFHIKKCQLPLKHADKQILSKTF